MASANTSSSQNNVLSRVSCAASTSCVAVGYYYNGTHFQTLAEAWNGTTWSIVASPDATVSHSNWLLGVSCASSNSCTAVGHYYNGTLNQTLVENWNGTSWSVAATPNTSAAQNNYLYGV